MGRRAWAVLASILVATVAAILAAPFIWHINRRLDADPEYVPGLARAVIDRGGALMDWAPSYLFAGFALGAAFAFVVLRGWRDSSPSGAPAREHQPILPLRRTLLGSRRRERADAIARWRRMAQDIQRDIDTARGSYDRGDALTQIGFHDTAAAIAQRHPDYRHFMSMCKREFAHTKWNMLKRWQARRMFGKQWRAKFDFRPPGYNNVIGSSLDAHVDDISGRLDILESWWKISKRS